VERRNDQQREADGGGEGQGQQAEARGLWRRKAGARLLRKSFIEFRYRLDNRQCGGAKLLVCLSGGGWDPGADRGVGNTGGCFKTTRFGFLGTTPGRFSHPE